MKKFKFKFIDGGIGGLEVSFQEILSSGNMSAIDDVSRKRKIPVSQSLISKVQKIKFYFLNLTGYWIPPYDKLFNKDSMEFNPIQGPVPTGGEEMIRKLFQNTEITGAGGDETGFFLTGKIEVIEGKYMGISSVKATVNDDLWYFNECYEALIDIMNGISEYLQHFQLTIENARKTLKSEDIEGLNEKEIIEKYAKYLEDKGWIMLEAPDNVINEYATSPGQEAEPEPEEKDEKEENKEEEEEKDEASDVPWSDDQKGTPEKSEPYGPPAASIGADLEGEIPLPTEDIPNDEAVDLESLEHTENIGPKDEEEDW